MSSCSPACTSSLKSVLQPQTKYKLINVYCHMKREHIEEMGINSILMKPLSVNDLANTVRRILNGHQDNITHLKPVHLFLIRAKLFQEYIPIDT